MYGKEERWQPRLGVANVTRQMYHQRYGARPRDTVTAPAILQIENFHERLARQ
jgi:hypothetical protein